MFEAVSKPTQVFDLHSIDSLPNNVKIKTGLIGTTSRPFRVRLLPQSSKKKGGGTKVPGETGGVTLSVQGVTSVQPVTAVQSTCALNAPSPDGDWKSAFKKELDRLRLLQEIPVGGRLQFFWRAWRNIGASKRVSRWLRRGYRLPFHPGGEQEARLLFKSVCPPTLIISYSNVDKMSALVDLVDTLLQKRVIEPVPPHESCLHNIVFLRPKPNGTWRLILDVSALNKFLVVKTFTMDTANVIRQSVVEDSFGTSVDWSDAYHHVPVHPNFRNFLAFQVGAHRFRYICCPFGLSPLPQVFTEICLPLKAYVRQQWECPVFQYLDDWLFFASAPPTLGAVTRAFVNLCISLGLGVNLEKSSLLPCRRLVHLGVEWDFQTASVRPPLDKSGPVAVEAEYVASTPSVPLPRLESLLGKLVALEKLVSFGRLHLRAFQSFLLHELRDGRRFRWLSLTDDARTDLRWWSDRTRLTHWVPVRPPKPMHIVFTDASTQGWGASCEGQTISGLWSPAQRKQHINVLEMQAILSVLKSWSVAWQGQPVLICSDNLSCVFYINKQGGTRSPNLMRVTAAVLRRAEAASILLTAIHVKGELNVLADILSRRHTVLRNEWRLAPMTFHWICSVSPWGRPTLELFANKMNHLLPRYVSPCVDVDAFAVDALVCEWPAEVLYAFPPFTILDRVLLKILVERPQRLLLVAPFRPLAAWFPRLRASALSVTLIPEPMLTLLQPHFDHACPHPTQLSLALWCIRCPASGR